MSTLFGLLEKAPEHKSAVILPESGECISYERLRELVRDAAQKLKRERGGADAREHIAIVMPNGLDLLVHMFAASSAGTGVPLNPAYSSNELEYFLRDSASKHLVTRGGLQGVHGDKASFSTEHKDTALLMYTSGSTGKPKCVPLQHEQLLASAENIVRTYRLTPDDTTIALMPLYHVHGFVASVLATFISGGTVVLTEKFSSDTFWNAFRNYRLTWYSAVPTVHSFILARKPTRALGNHIRFVRSCSASLAPATQKGLESVFGVPVIEAYGMTEATHQIASNPLETVKTGSVGLGTGVRIRVVDEFGADRTVGTVGEVVIQGNTVFEGYRNDEKSNKTSFLDGWFRTGDAGYMDADGYLFLTDRVKDIINRGGEKVSPREVEAVLRMHPRVADAACFGIPDTLWGERIGASVIARDGIKEEELVSFCRSKLADFKCPERIFLMNSLPRTETGKIKRKELAATFS